MYPYREICTLTGKYVPLQGNIYLYREIYTLTGKYIPLQGNIYPCTEICTITGTLDPLKRPHIFSKLLLKHHVAQEIKNFKKHFIFKLP